MSSAQFASAPEARVAPVSESEGETLLALDIGSAQVRCALVGTDGEAPRWLAGEEVPSFGLRDGAVVDLERAAESIRIAAEGARLEGRRPKRAVVGFSGGARLSFARGSLVFPGGAREIRAGDLARLRRSLHSDAGPAYRTVLRMDGPYGAGELADVEWPVGLRASGLALTSAFLSAPAERLESALRAVRCAGLEIEHLALAPHAAALGVLGDDERRLGAAVLDFGAGGFRGALWDGGRLRQLGSAAPERGSANAGAGPNGMLALETELARGFRLAPPAARRLLQEHGLEAGRRDGSGGPPGEVEVTAVDGIQHVRVDLGKFSETAGKLLSGALRRLRDELSFFSANHAGGVVLTGSGALLPGLPAMVSRHFGGAPVRVGAPRWAGRSSDAAFAGPGACTVCGLAVLGLAARAQLRRGARGWPGALASIARRLAACMCAAW